MPITYHVVVPFGRSDDGDLVPLEPIEARDPHGAKNRARDAAAKRGGAIAFSRTGDPNTGEFGDAVILATYGEVDKNMLGEWRTMPIRRHHRWLYPINWRELSASIRFRRAKGRCEGCGRPHGRIAIHLGDGIWWDEERSTWHCGKGRVLRQRIPAPTDNGSAHRTTRVVLATAHLDHDPVNNDGSNLAALCQRCHILHDREEHRRRRRLTYRARRALGDLFTGPYP